MDKGLLDFARFDLEQDEALRLAVSGERVEKGKLRNPCLVIANYAFDTVRHDVYRVRSGLLQEALVTVTSSRREESLDDPGLLERIKLRWEGEPLDSVHVYEDELDQSRAGRLHPPGRHQRAHPRRARCAASAP